MQVNPILSERTWNVRMMSPIRFVLVFGGLLFIFNGLLLFGIEHSMMLEWRYHSLNKIEKLIFHLICLVLFYWIGFRLANGNLLISVHEAGIRWYWQRRYVFSRAKEEEFSWSEIQKYIFPIDRYYYPLRLTLYNGRIILLYRDKMVKNDDFKAFKEDFVAEIARWNEHAQQLDRPIIVEGGSFYETKAAVVWMYILIFFVLLFVAACVFFREVIAPPLWVHIVVVGLSYMYIGHVLSTRSKMK